MREADVMGTTTCMNWRIRSLAAFIVAVPEKGATAEKIAAPHLGQGDLQYLSCRGIIKRLTSTKDYATHGKKNAGNVTVWGRGHLWDATVKKLPPSDRKV